MDEPVAVVDKDGNREIALPCHHPGVGLQRPRCAVLRRAGLSQHRWTGEIEHAPTASATTARIIWRSCRASWSVGFPFEVACWPSTRCGITVSPAATDATTAAIVIGEAWTFPWPIMAAARPVGAGSFRH